jgi:hypothetical protein
MFEGFCFAAFCLLASRQTHTQGNDKITKEKSTGKTQMETCSVCDHVKKKGKKKAAKQNPSNI